MVKSALSNFILLRAKKSYSSIDNWVSSRVIIIKVGTYVYSRGNHCPGEPFVKLIKRLFVLFPYLHYEYTLLSLALTRDFVHVEIYNILLGKSVASHQWKNFLNWSICFKDYKNKQ